MQTEFLGVRRILSTSNFAIKACSIEHVTMLFTTMHVQEDLWIDFLCVETNTLIFLSVAIGPAGKGTLWFEGMP